MPKEAIMSPKLFDSSIRSYSHAVRVGNLLFLAGQLGNTPDRRVEPGNFEAQVRQSFANIEAVLAEVGATLDNVVTMTVFITDMRHGDDFTRLRGELLGRPFPASTLVAVSHLARPDALVEIQAIAVLD